jgi:UDP:flavonoid glycosyltransferase YjiC (YdhE family)
VIEAVADLDIELVVLVNPADAERLGSLPPNVLAPGTIPLHLVLPSCEAVIHHGGCGCMMTAINAGIPQLCLPITTDLYENAARLVKTGAGLDADGRRPDSERIRQRLHALLEDPHHRVAAGRLQGQLVERPTPPQLIPVLEEISRTGRRTGRAA